MIADRVKKEISQRKITGWEYLLKQDEQKSAVFLTLGTSRELVNQFNHSFVQYLNRNKRGLSVCYEERKLKETLTEDSGVYSNIYLSKKNGLTKQIVKYILDSLSEYDVLLINALDMKEFLNDEVEESVELLIRACEKNDCILWFTSIDKSRLTLGGDQMIHSCHLEKYDKVLGLFKNVSTIYSPEEFGITLSESGYCVKDLVIVKDLYALNRRPQEFLKLNNEQNQVLLIPFESLWSNEGKSNPVLQKYVGQSSFYSNPVNVVDSKLSQFALITGFDYSF